MLLLSVYTATLDLSSFDECDREKEFEKFKSLFVNETFDEKPFFTINGQANDEGFVFLDQIVFGEDENIYIFTEKAMVNYLKGLAEKYDIETKKIYSFIPDLIVPERDFTFLFDWSRTTELVDHYINRIGHYIAKRYTKEPSYVEFNILQNPTRILNIQYSLDENMEKYSFFKDEDLFEIMETVDHPDYDNLPLLLEQTYNLEPTQEDLFIVPLTNKQHDVLESYAEKTGVEFLKLVNMFGLSSNKKEFIKDLKKKLKGREKVGF